MILMSLEMSFKDYCLSWLFCNAIRLLMGCFFLHAVCSYHIFLLKLISINIGSILINSYLVLSRLSSTCLHPAGNPIESLNSFTYQQNYSFHSWNAIPSIYLYIVMYDFFFLLFTVTLSFSIRFSHFFFSWISLQGLMN